MLPNVVGEIGYFCVLPFPRKEKETPGSLSINASSVREKGECPGVIESVLLVKEGLESEVVAACVMDFSFGRWR